MSRGRTSLLMAEAAARVGACLESIGPTDMLARLRHADRSVIVAKTRSPFLTLVAQTLSNNKYVARRWIAATGVPVVPDVLSDDAEPHPPAARALLATHGHVVVKPNGGNRAIGVHVDVRDEDMLWAACAHARSCDRDEEAVVEPFVAGANVRVAIVGGRFVAAAIVERPVLAGDGIATPAQLIARLNQDSRRGSWRDPGPDPLDAVEIDDELEAMLDLHGLTIDQPMPSDRSFELLGEEAETIDLTDALHPDWAAACEKACARLGVDVGGVDLRGPAPAFQRAPPPAYEPGGPALLEVNVLPALHVHACPTRGAARPVFEAFVRYCLQLPGAPPPCADVPAV